MRSLILFVLLKCQCTNFLDAFSITPLISRSLRCLTASSSTISSTEPNPSLVRQLNYFTTHVLDTSQTFNMTVISRMQSETVMGLIRSDVQEKAADETIVPIPSTYIYAVDWIDRTIEFMKHSTDFSPLYTTARLIPKKEGSATMRRGKLSIEDGMTRRDVIEFKRKTERCISLLLTLIIGYRASLSLGSGEDVVYFSKVLLERVPVHDRHLSLLLLFRGALSPLYQGTVLSPTEASYKLRHQEAMRSLGIVQPSSTSRLCFPLFTFALHCYNWQQQHERPGLVSSQGLGQGQGVGVGRRTEGAARFTECDAAVCRLLRACTAVDDEARDTNGLEGTGEDVMWSLRRWLGDQSSLFLLNSEHEQYRPIPTPTPISSGSIATAAASATIRAKSPNKSTRSLVAGEEEEEDSLYDDKTTTAANGNGNGNDIEDDGDSLIGSRGLLPEPIERGLPEEIRRNTIAMELLETSKQFPVTDMIVTAVAVVGKGVPGSRGGGGGGGGGSDADLFDIPQQVQNRFKPGALRHFAELGRLVSMMVTLSVADTREEEGETLVVALRRFMATFSALLSLPDTHKLRRQISSRIGGFHPLQISPEDIRRLKASYKGSSKSSSSAGNYNDNDDGDDLWVKGRQRQTSTNVDSSSEDLFAPPASAKGQGVRSKAGRSGHSDGAGTSITQNPNALSTELRRSLYELVAEQLSVPLSELGSSFASELDDIFRTWRRPHLLLDYLRMHSWSPDLQRLIRRFLLALWAISNETVDDIRYRDEGNLRHLNRLPAAIQTAWREGHVEVEVAGRRVNTLLPGYADTQTLFMMGEDGNTCMSIRARQKTTNRGLLSLVLHGNCRVLGKKDSTGRLLSRALVRLLIDETTGFPVLFVHAPIGSNGEETEDLEIYDEAAELGELLGLPVVYAQAPPPDSYAFKPFEICASAAIGETGVKCRLLDYTVLAPYVWKEGVRDIATGRFPAGMAPLLTRPNATDSAVLSFAEGLMLGVRPTGSLESLDLSHLDLSSSVSSSSKTQSGTDIKNKAYQSPISGEGLDWWQGVLGPAPQRRKPGQATTDSRPVVAGIASKPLQRQSNSIQARQAERQRVLGEQRQQRMRKKVPLSNEGDLTQERDDSL
eukprot:gene4776-9502_t